MSNENSLPADLAADLQSIDNEAQKLLNPAEPMDATATPVSSETNTDPVSAQPSTISAPSTGLVFPPAFWLREIAGVSYANGIWTFISVESGNRAFMDPDVLEFLYYSYARGRGWSVTKPLFYDYFAMHVNSRLDPNTRSFWTLLDDDGKVFRSKKPVAYLCIWTRQELHQMHINFFKLRENASSYYPKPTKPTLQGRDKGSFGLSEEEAKVLAKFLLKDEKKGKGRDVGGLKKKKKNEKAIRGSQKSNKFRNDVPALLGSFQRSTAPVPGPSTSGDDSAMVE
ncbi:hypothetical protein F5880DRAFT_1503111 [Lentinula raphanica]|nr:hypothetical protein F5880DRAFT_1503111 [Lentinula raphanica]